MSSWFGGPSRSSSHRERRDRETHDRERERERDRDRTTIQRRESASGTASKGYFVRPHSPSSRSGGRRDSSPKAFFVRPHSPGGRSTTSSSRHLGKEHHENGGTGSRGLFSAVMGAAAGGRHGASSSSYYKRRPRDGYIARLMQTIRRLFRNLYNYARRNPIKLFMLVIMPLVTGGALHGILKQMGVRVPAGMAGFMGGNKGMDGRGGSQGAGAGGGMGIEQVMGIAKMFI